jgi:hypothetical protein
LVQPVVSTDGSVFASGAANYNGGVGAVRVFQRKANGTYTQLGDPIEGTTSAVIGGVDGISGSVDSGIPTLLVASSGGVISTYQFVSDAWITKIQPIFTGLRGSPAIRGSTSLGSFVAGSRNQVVIYSLA